MVATPNLFLKPVFFSGSSSRRDPDSHVVLFREMWNFTYFEFWKIYQNRTPLSERALRNFTSFFEILYNKLKKETIGHCLRAHKN